MAWPNLDNGLGQKKILVVLLAYLASLRFKDFLLDLGMTKNEQVSRLGIP